jgi:uncharacterized protein
MKYKLFFSSISIFAILIMFYACSETPTAEQQNARKELDQKGIVYTPKAFFDEIGKGNIDNLNLFFAAGMSPNVKVKDMTALNWAIMMSSNEGLKLLLNKGANVNGKTGNQISTLMFAAKLGGRADEVKILIDNGANINEKSGDGNTALIFAASSKDIETVKVLIDNKADVNIKTSDGKTALMLANEVGSAEIVQLLKQAGAKE